MYRLVFSTVIILNILNFGSGWEQGVARVQFNPGALQQHQQQPLRPKRSSSPSYRDTDHHEMRRRILLDKEKGRRRTAEDTGSEAGSSIIDISRSSSNTSVLVGKQIILACQIPKEALGNESVSWIRHSDSGLLAVNDFVYTTSHRVKVFHVVGSPQWKLSINPVQVTDAGLYECQVSTTPHTSHFIALNVVEPKTTILGNHDMYIEAGSTINLTCIIQADSMRDSHIYWNYNGKIIAYDRKRGGTIVIDKRPGGQTVTSLIISQASPQDSGSYTCDPASAYSKSIRVHVTTGSDEAAMRPNAIVRSTSSPQPRADGPFISMALAILVLSSTLLGGDHLKGGPTLFK